MERFHFSRFSFLIRCKSPLLLPPYKGSTFRGGFGHAFRRITCALKGKECVDCLLKKQCVYAYVFETPIPPDAQMMRKYTVAPHPFILEPPTDTQRTYEEGEDLSFGLTLIGRAVDYLPYFIYAFDELGRIGIGKGKGKYQLVEVAEDGPVLTAPISPSPLPSSLAACDELSRIGEGKGEGEPHQSKNVIYRGDNKLLSQPNGPVRWSDVVAVAPTPPATIRLSFTTPARIKYEGRLTKDLEFHIFFRNLLRRISLLSYFHCGHKLDDQGFKALIAQAKKVKTVKKVLYWDDWERYSSRQQTRMNMGGFLGEITYEGDFAPFWPYMRLGEYVHVGKGSSFGLGRYRIAPI